jgi:hypothetical protein
VAVRGGDCAGRMTYFEGRGRGVERVSEGRDMGSVIVGKAIAEWNSGTALRSN